MLVEAGLADELLSAVLLSGRHSVCTYIATTSVRELVKLGSGSECKYRYRKALEIKRNGWNYQCFQLKFIFYFEIYQISFELVVISYKCFPLQALFFLVSANKKKQKKSFKSDVKTGNAVYKLYVKNAIFYLVMSFFTHTKRQ